MSEFIIFKIAADCINNSLENENWILVKSIIDNNITLTIVTTLISILAGYSCSIKKRFWRNFTILFCAFFFTFYIFLRTVFISEPFINIIISSIVWGILCFIVIAFVHEKDIISRKKINKMIIDFTSTANPNKDVCIFAGDLDFFGDVIDEKNLLSNIKSSNHNFFTKLNYLFTKNMLGRTNIENNEQLEQLKKLKFRKICILCIKPPLEEAYKKDRIRIGYLSKTLNDRVHFKFFSEECDNCSFNEHFNCKLQECTENCFDKMSTSCKCPRASIKLLKPSLPDNTLRGRIVTNRETDAKCVAITTKKSSGKKYILRQFGSGEKESNLYTIIWNVWWKMCESDDDFVKTCEEELSKYTQEDNEIININK